jgi:hypothetical protein
MAVCIPRRSVEISGQTGAVQAVLGPADETAATFTYLSATGSSVQFGPIFVMREVVLSGFRAGSVVIALRRRTRARSIPPGSDAVRNSLQRPVERRSYPILSVAGTRTLFLINAHSSLRCRRFTKSENRSVDSSILSLATTT